MLVILFLGLLALANSGVAQSNNIFACFGDDQTEITTITVVPANDGILAFYDGDMAEPITARLEGGKLSLLGDDFLGVMNVNDQLELKVLNMSGRLVIQRCLDVTSEAIILSTDYDLLSESEARAADLVIDLTEANNKIKELEAELKQLMLLTGQFYDESPLTSTEQEDFIKSIARCWNVDVGADWTRVIVTVGITLSPDGKIDGDVRLIDAKGGNDTQTAAAFQSARRALYRCGVSGYELPVGKYDQWKEMTVTFDPNTMHLPIEFKGSD